MSALCKAVAPAQVHVTYDAQQPLPFRLEWCDELGPASFAGASPDEAAERALTALLAGGTARFDAIHGRALLPEPGPKTLVRGAMSSVQAPVSEPFAQASWVEAMRERIQAIEEGKPVRRPNLRLVRS